MIIGYNIMITCSTKVLENITVGDNDVIRVNGVVAIHGVEI